MIAEYCYDAWGNLIQLLDANRNVLSSGTNYSIANANPFRYRGYYYDSETGFYYLNSRYYDPQVGRFLNADGIIGANGGLQGYNLFTYCNNNPVNFTDPTGYIGIRRIMLQDGAIPGGGSTHDIGVTPLEESISKAYDYVTNEDEEVVINAKFIAFYKYRMVIKLPIGKNAASFGIIFMGDEIENNIEGIDTVRHEYGHTVQLEKYGLFKYTTHVAIPSVTTRIHQEIYGWPSANVYYSMPWEYQAEVYGQTSRVTNGEYEYLPYSAEVAELYEQIIETPWIFLLP